MYHGQRYSFMGPEGSGEGGAGSGGGDGGGGEAGGSGDQSGSSGSGNSGAGGSGAGAGALFAKGAGDGDGDAGSAGDGGGGVGDAPITPEWARGFESADSKNYVTKQGWQSIDAVLESYQQLESKIGVPQDQLLRMKPLEDREAWHGPEGVFAKLGRPENAEGYDLPKIEVGEGGVDLTPSFRKFAFETGLSKSTAEAAVAWFGENVTTAEEALDLTRQAEQVKELEAVRIEWGQDWTTNVAAARRGMSMLGIDENMASAIEGEIGTKEFLGRMLNVGTLLGEHSAGEHGSGQAGSYLSQEEAISEIATLKANTDFMDVWVDGHADGNAEARTKMDALMQIAYPG